MLHHRLSTAIVPTGIISSSITSQFILPPLVIPLRNFTSKLGFNHGRLVRWGLMFFKAMNGVYNIVPEIQHYACMVDIYGRAGLLEEAEAFIKEMPVEAEGPIWGSLLNACKIHGNEEMFVRVSTHLHNDKGVSIGTYALLSNTYASTERWDDANKVRDVMRSMGLKKTAGCSWVEADGLIHGD